MAAAVAKRFSETTTPEQREQMAEAIEANAGDVYRHADNHHACTDEQEAGC